MKRLAFIIITLLSVITAGAQNNDDPFLSDVSDLFVLYNSDDYSKVIDEGERLAKTCDSLHRIDSDTLYVVIKTLISKSYYRNKQYIEAAVACDSATARMEKTGRTKDAYYAIIIDNSSMYYNAAEKYDIGLQRSLKALNAINNVPESSLSVDMQLILMHLAESYAFNKNYDEAILYEIRALNLTDKIYGKHSEDYLNELPYLADYYRDGGEEQKAAEIETEVEKLQEEYDNGIRDIPDPDERDLSSPEECHKNRFEALRCAKYYLEHKLNASYMNQSYKYLLRWMLVSPDLTINLGKNEAKLLENDKSAPYFVAYVAGCTKYAIENEDTTFTLEMWNDAVIDMVNFYVGNRDMTGKVKYLEKYVDAYNKGPEVLSALIEKNYPGEAKKE